MEETSIRVGKILGTPDGGWGQVHSFLPPDEQKLASRGQLVAVLSAEELGEGVEAVEAGREILARVHEEYFGKTKDEPFEALKKAVQRVGEEFEQKEIKLTIAALVLWQGIVYIAIWGQGKVAVLRDSKLGFVQKAVSGRVSQGDIFLLGTSKFFENMGEGVVRAALETRSKDEVVDQLLPLVHQRADQAQMAAAVVSFAGVAQPQAGPPSQAAEEEETSKEKQVLGKAKASFEAAKEKSLFYLSELAQKLPAQPIYVKGDQEQKKKTALSVAIVLIVLLALSGVLGLRQRRINLFRATYEQRLSQAEEKLEEAATLSDLNPVRTRELVSQVQTSIEQLKAEGVEDARLAQLKARMGEVLGTALGEHRLEGSLFLDLSVIRDGLSGVSLVASGEEVLLFDQEGGRLVSFDFAGRDAKVLAGGEQIEGSQLAAFYAGRPFVLRQGKVFEIEQGRAKEVVVGEDWGEIILFEAYAGNLYLADRQNGEVWRYPAIEGGFGQAQPWFAEGISKGFSETKDLAIDGSIWFLEEGGEIKKYTLGAPESFSLLGFAEALSQPVALFTSDTLDNLYLLDPQASRVVVFDKKGEYQKAIIWEGIGEARDLAVSEKEGKILLLTGNKIYEIDLP